MSRIHTYVEIGGQTRFVGEAYFNFRRGRLTATFSYERNYIALPGAYAVDPALSLMTGSWPLPNGLPGAFSDAAPDRWGRNLVSRRLRGEAVAAGRPAPTLNDRDYLLGVSDETRQGALRFKTEASDEFDINPNPNLSTHRVTSMGGAANPADEVNALLMYAESFGLTDSQARAVLGEVADAVANWESVARSNGISQSGISRFERTLSHTIDAVRIT